MSIEETPTFRRQAVFQYGHDAHARWQRWMTQLRLLEGVWDCAYCGARFYAAGPVQCDCGSYELTYRELELRDETLMIAGRTDGFVPLHRALVEIKTVGEGTVRMEAPDLLERYTIDTSRGRLLDVKGLWSNLHRPFTSHLRQGQIYLHCARAMGMDVDKIIYLYDAKLDQDAKEFVVPYNPAPIRRVLFGAQQVADAMRERGPVPACQARGGQCEACDAVKAAA